MKKIISGEKNKLQKVSRRNFFKIAGIGTASLSLQAGGAVKAQTMTGYRNVDGKRATQLGENVRVVHSVCLGCNSGCGAGGVVKDGRLVNIAGNPYHPYYMNFEPLPYNSPVKNSLPISSPVCGKTLDSSNHSYSPYRLLKPLKRSGPTAAATCTRCRRRKIFISGLLPILPTMPEFPLQQLMR